MRNNVLVFLLVICFLGGCSSFIRVEPYTTSKVFSDFNVDYMVYATYDKIVDFIEDNNLRNCYEENFFCEDTFVALAKDQIEKSNLCPYGMVVLENNILSYEGGMEKIPVKCLDQPKKDVSMPEESEL